MLRSCSTARTVSLHPGAPDAPCLPCLPPIDQKEMTAYLADVDTGEYPDFRRNLNDIADEKSAAYAVIKIPGMSHPRYQYVAGEPRKIGFKLVFFKGAVMEWVNRLRSLRSATLLRRADHTDLPLARSLRPLPGGVPGNASITGIRGGSPVFSCAIAA